MLYAIGDIHGELERLEVLLDSLPLTHGDRFVFLGDYIDRGSESRAVIDRLIALEQEYPCVFLLGNHESMLLDFLGYEGPAYCGGSALLSNGGDKTLAEYGFFDLPISARSSFSLPHRHEEFFRRLKLYHAEADYLFVHAGLDPRQLDRSSAESALHHCRVEHLLWNRTSPSRPHSLGITIIYGHTPSEDMEVRWNVPFSIGIDTGAVYGGPLTALRLPDFEVFQAH
ncbi:MAG: hypothetical protein CBC48_11325 [bacterium TMED88]|nr:hypothetical protein [Deltaproteobacteria bacterium]OUV29933.1 MAG: hypothetical protein CBC48_11325 [bacterium TMED88]